MSSRLLGSPVGLRNISVSWINLKNCSFRLILNTKVRSSSIDLNSFLKTFEAKFKNSFTLRSINAVLFSGLSVFHEIGGARVQIWGVESDLNRSSIAKKLIASCIIPLNTHSGIFSFSGAIDNVLNICSLIITVSEYRQVFLIKSEIFWTSPK